MPFQPFSVFLCKPPPISPAESAADKQGVCGSPSWGVGLEKTISPAFPSRPHNILHWIDENFEKPVIVICLLVALILIPYQVFTRYILGTWLQFNVDTSMVEELSLFCFITAIYF